MVITSMTRGDERVSTSTAAAQQHQHSSSSTAAQQHQQHHSRQHQQQAGGPLAGRGQPSAGGVCSSAGKPGTLCRGCPGWGHGAHKSPDAAICGRASGNELREVRGHRQGP
ncbi:hypothetical protein BLJ79_12280 [Arthrobacter sp. UCD-GKA]|nr:hypothetical protein BLJ79_12280 [Arthrobacter sp. UCD-GKA]